MKRFVVISSLALVSVVSSLYATPARADVIAAAMKPSLCLDVNDSSSPKKVALWTCHGGANQNFFTGAFGPQKYNGLCLDSNGSAQGSGLIMTTCNSTKPSQRWSLIGSATDANAIGSLRNDSGWCVNIPGGNASPGVQVIIWTCPAKTATSRSNDVWGRGVFKTVTSFALPPLAIAALANAGAIVTSGGNIVAAGGGNIVAAGGGNIVAAGGGNIVAAGGGNAIAGTGGAFIKG